MHRSRCLVIGSPTHDCRKRIVEDMPRMVYRHARRLCYQHKFIVFENDLKVRRHFGLGVIRYVVKHLVATVYNRLKVCLRTVHRQKSARYFFAPQFSTMVGKALAERIKQQPALMFGLHHAIEIHIRRCARHYSLYSPCCLIYSYTFGWSPLGSSPHRSALRIAVLEYTPSKPCSGPSHNKSA